MSSNKKILYQKINEIRIMRQILFWLSSPEVRMPQDVMQDS